MLIVEFRVDSPILEEALNQQPETTVTNEEVYQFDEEIKYLFWAETSDFDAFDAALATDPTVANPQTLTESNTRRLYRVTLTSQGEDVATFPVWSQLDLVLLDAHATHEGWHVRMRMPDREALAAYREMCREQGFSFELESVYRDTEVTGRTEAGLSPPQQEALQTALYMGYFEIPRQASLADVADQLEISSQSVSERLRRGVATLLATTLPQDGQINA